MADGKTSSTIYFSKMSQSDLVGTLDRINRDRFPANYAACVAEIRHRKDKGSWDEAQAQFPQGNQVPKLLAGVWIRVAADIIDLAILWAFAFALSLGMESWFVMIGETGVWFGLMVSIAYFVPSQSGFGNGQSLGKWLLGIQVLDINGQLLTLKKSFLRYLTIAFVGYFGVFTGIANSIVGSALSTFVGSILNSLWFIALVGCYLLIPLHPLKRGLHDLIADSIVVYRDRYNAAALAELNNPAKTKRAFGIVGVVSAVIVVLGLWSIAAITEIFDMATMQDVQAKLESTGQFSGTRVTSHFVSTKSGTTRAIIVHAFVGGPLDQTREDLKPLFDLAFQTVRDQIKDLSSYDNLRVGLRFGYFLGIRMRLMTLFQEENPSHPGGRKDAGSSSNF